VVFVWSLKTPEPDVPWQTGASVALNVARDVLTVL
jgi:hypothetical protein